MDGVILLGILSGLACQWVLLGILLRLLRQKHAAVYFSQLGAPSVTQIASNTRMRRARWNLQWRFMRFLWSFEFLRLRDPVVTGVGVAAIVVTIATFALFFGLDGVRVK
jgi:hypothetical protein